MIKNNIYGKTDFKKEVVLIEPSEERKEKVNYHQYLSSVRVSDLNLLVDTLGVEDFKSDYKEHENIKRFDIGSLYGNTHKHVLVLAFKDSVTSEYNIINLEDNSKNIKGTKRGNGAFIKSNHSSVSTLIITDGLVHAINASIAFERADILATTSSSDVLKTSGIEFKNYRSIILATSRGNTSYTHFLNANYLPKKVLKKIRIIDYSSSYSDVLNNLSDIISKIVTVHNTKRLRLRGGIKMLKDSCKEDSFILEYMKEQVAEALERFRKLKIEPLGMDITKVELLNLIEKTLLNGGSAKEIIEHYINLYTNIPIDSESKLDITLNSGEYLSSSDINIWNILRMFNEKRKHIFLNAPTGTGKTHILYSKSFLNSVIRALVVVAYRDVVNEIGANGYSDIRVGDSKERITELLKSDKVVMTTDVFSFLLDNHRQIFLQYLKRLGVIVFDEQHLYYDSLGFRDTTVVKCYDFLMNQNEINVLFMSGTPILPTNKKIGLVTIKRKENDKPIIKAHINVLEDTKAVKESIEEQLKKGSVLFYCSSVAKSEEVLNLFTGGKEYDTILINRDGYYFNKKESKYRYDNIVGAVSRAKTNTILYVATTKATTGVNFPNLKTVYQYGTPYSPNTLVQLVARLRAGGDFFMILPKHESNRLEYRSHTAKAITTKILDVNAKTLSKAFDSEEFNKWFREYVSLSLDSFIPKEFIKKFGSAFKLMHSIGIGVLSRDKAEFTMNTNTTFKDIKTAFDADDINQRRKYIERLAIDSLILEDVEALNRIYNLSFIVEKAKVEKKLKNKPKLRLITEADKDAKKVKREKELKEKEGKFKEIDKKLSEFNLSVKALQNKDFTDEEILKLGDFKRLDEVNIVKDKEGKIMALRFYITPRKTILKEIYDSMQGKDWVTVKDVAMDFRSRFITTRNSNPFSKLIISLLTSDSFLHAPFQYKKYFNDKESGKRYWNVIALSDDIKKDYGMYDIESRRIAIHDRIDAF